MSKWSMVALVMLVATGAAQTSAPLIGAASRPGPASTSRPRDKAAGEVAAQWAKTPGAAMYANATAHAPRFDDKDVWLNLTGKEAFTKQQWAPARLLVWAHANAAAAKGKDPEDPANWLENGKPATKLYDIDTDVLLPESADGKPYMISSPTGRDKGRLDGFSCRHLTIGANASIRSAGIKVSGNLWVKRDGKMYNSGSLQLIGTGDAFLRCDDRMETDAAENGFPARPSGITQYIQFHRPGGTCEIVGAVASGDEFRVHPETTVILHRGAVVCWGRNAVLEVQKGAKVAMMDFSRFHKWVNQFGRMGDAECQGTIQGGLPDRPLSEGNAELGLGFNNWNGTVFPMPENANPSSLEKTASTHNRRFFGMILHTGSALKTYSVNPDKARLVVCWHGIVWSQYIHEYPSGEIKDGVRDLFNAIPRQITVVFNQGVEVDGVTFDDVHPGGLLMRDPSEASKWKDVRFGPRNAGPRDMLIAPIGTLVIKNR
jgi:hypothetical protein